MSALSQIEAAHARHRAGLLAAESAEQRRLVASYAKAIREVEGRLAKLAVEIASATENLDPLDAAEVLRGKRVAQARLEGVLADMRYEVAKWTDSITPEIEALHAEAVRRGVEAAESLTRIGLGTPPPGSEAMIGRAFASVDHGAVEQAVAFSHGGPVRELLDTLAGEAAEEVAQEMTSAIARGQNPLVTASRVRSKLAAPLYRAQTITRTETLRAYREATREAYQQSNLVKSWVWIAACDSRTCGACWALHGKEFPTGEKMGTHPRCRCTMAPNTRSWEELTGLRQPGVQETNLAANITSGPELFDALPDSQKLAILGPSKFAAYQDGAISLDDLIHVEDNAVWGTTRREASLRSILGDDAKGYYPKPKPPPPPPTPSTPPTPKPPETPPAAGGIDDGIGGTITEQEIADQTEMIRDLGGSASRDDVIERIRATRARQAQIAAEKRQALTAGKAARKIESTVGTVPAEIEAEVADALDQIRTKIPDVERLAALPDKATYRHIRGSTEASYTPLLDEMEIDVRYPGKIGFNYAHEYGHFLDYRWGGAVGEEFSGEARSAARAALLDVLRDTDMYRGLRALRARLTGSQNAGQRKYLDYLLSDEELVARAFSEWIATTGRSPAIRAAYMADREARGAAKIYSLTGEERQRVSRAIERWIGDILG